MPKPALSSIPPDLLCAEDYAHKAREHLTEATYAHLSEGSGLNQTNAANCAAFSHFRVYNRVLRKNAHGHTHWSLWGENYAHPICLAPIGFQQLFHPQGELAWADGARAAETPIVLSHYASTPLERVSQANPQAFYQLYWQSRETAAPILQRIQAAGFRAVIVTVDTPVYGARYASHKAGFVMPAHIRAVNVPANNPLPRTLESHERVIFQGYMADTMGWEDVAWLVKQSPLPVVLKGVTHPDDARQARAIGVQGIVVSSHGGRALDCGLASLDALPAIRLAVGDDMMLWLDSGIRSGSDVFKAIALGADAVMIGRPAIYALAVAGALGVAHMLTLLRQELEITMAQAGCFSLRDVRASALFRAGM